MGNCLRLRKCYGPLIKGAKYLVISVKTDAPAWRTTGCFRLLHFDPGFNKKSTFLRPYYERKRKTDRCGFRGFTFVMDPVTHAI